MAPGFSALNHLTVIQLSHGLSKYLKEAKPGQPLSIVIGYDGRHRSSLFANDAASVFIRNGITVHMFSKVVPTPLVSFATPFLKCSAGLMITASHNPKEDNGYKAVGLNELIELVSCFSTGIMVLRLLLSVCFFRYS